MNKQALTEALEFYEAARLSDYDDRSFHTTLLAAARLVERLLPGVCEKCEGDGVYAYIDHATIETGESAFVACSACHSSGQVWDEGIVEAVADQIALKMYNNHLGIIDPWYQERCREAAVAVLSALVELLTGKVE